MLMDDDAVPARWVEASLRNVSHEDYGALL